MGSGPLAPASSLQLTLAWLLVFLPAIVLAVAFLLAALRARARLSPRLVLWGARAWALGPCADARGDDEVVLHPPQPLLARGGPRGDGGEPGDDLLRLGALALPPELERWAEGIWAPVFAVPWRWVLAGTLALAVPAGVVGASIAWNPYALHRYVGDDHLRAGRLDAAVGAYRAALATRPSYGRAWYRLGSPSSVGATRRRRAGLRRRRPARAAEYPPANDLGVALFRQGRHAEAAAAFARASALDPDDAEPAGTSASRFVVSAARRRRRPRSPGCGRSGRLASR